ncbi:MAG: glutathione S-transferase family protein [Nannocystaceae bacterium]
MGRLDQGKWYTETEIPRDGDGRFVRAASSFRNRISAQPGSAHPVVAGRYHLYVAYACPWAHRTLIGRELLGLSSAISISVANTHMGDDGWIFSPGKAEIPDELNGIDPLWQLYVKADPQASGRATVPVLWDREANTIVNNESREILRMLSTEFTALHREGAPQLCPPELRERIDEAIDAIYEPINNGVYRSGFAQSQSAYEEAVGQLFDALDHWEGVLAKQRWVCGDRFTEADICLFTTLLRFDPVYVTHFKCNLRRLVDYPNLWGFTRDVYQMPGVASTVFLDQIKRHYFGSHGSVNPSGVVPVGPDIDFMQPHDRARLG